MNKAFNIVNHTEMSVVISELNRKEVDPPRQFRRSVLAGLIAGILLPAMPVLAEDYKDVVLVPWF